MHTLQPKHKKLTSAEVEKLLQKLNISSTQLPKISKKDTMLPEESNKGDIIQIDRGEGDMYYRVVI